LDQVSGRAPASPGVKQPQELTTCPASPS
jgi:hypothetical protein